MNQTFLVSVVVDDLLQDRDGFRGRPVYGSSGHVSHYLQMYRSGGCREGAFYSYFIGFLWIYPQPYRISPCPVWWRSLKRQVSACWNNLFSAYMSTFNGLNANPLRFYPPPSFLVSAPDCSGVPLTGIWYGFIRLYHVFVAFLDGQFLV